MHSMDNFRRPPRRKAAGSIDGFVNPPGRTAPNLSDLSSLSGGAQGPATSRRIGRFDQADGFNSVRTPITSSQNGLRSEEHHLSAAQSLSDLKTAESSTAGQPLPSAEPRRGHRSKQTKRARAKTIAKRSALVLTSIVVVIGAFLLVKAYWQLRHVFGGGSSVIASTNPGRINVLLLGIGGDGHDGPDLTDTILLASIDPINNKAVLLSIPRDLWVQMPSGYVGQYAKINAAYESGKYTYLGEQSSSNKNQKAIDAGFKAVNKTVGSVLDVPINYDVLVDFKAFHDAVDAVNGVTINVPTQLYDPTIAWENHGNSIIAQPGLQTMGGAKALLYARSRETTSDFARTQRQRALLVALENKALTLGTVSNPFKISRLLSAFGSNVRTNISLSDAESLYNIMKKIPSKNIASVGFANPPNNFVTTGTIDGQSIVEPIAGLFSYKPIQNYVHSILRDGYLTKENAKIEVLNGSTVAGLANEEANKLTFYGYKVKSIANAPSTSYTKTVLIDLTHGKDSYTRDSLEKNLNVSAITALPDKSIKSNGANFVIIVGQ